ncbi:hypothetical protein FEZ18_13175 [Oceanihabitans sp. IOP_32]|uniref:DUF6146 family protein n=1 Tax=Oceanihabitans sp. IOP_32 TaxID=2529032 RepID=UPI0012939026|nr:DUF6146 family protein [Oceanihabitans sp. IOP_32]QFZ55681.1 hypothetical protein FEZ18_13175 [Oceanihabitans sp. IOP_32]
MKTLQTLFYITICILVASCNTTKPITSQSAQAEKEQALINNDTVTIANDKLEYEIIIIEPGFNFWLASRAKPKGYYSQHFLETRNRQYVIAWNQRVMQPQRYDPGLYEMQIDYQPEIDYGYDVNYKLYNYFIYFQLTYKQQLTHFTPRI